MKAQQPNVSNYKVCINKRYGTLSAENCRVQVSIGNPKYEGEKFVALMEWANRRYKRIDVIVSDTLQRHNLPEPDSAATWNKTRHEGLAWIKRNRRALQGTGLVMWDDLLVHPAYKAATNEIANAVKMTAVWDEIENTARQFARRNGSSIAASTDFLLEELAVFSVIFQHPAIDVYAGSWISNIFDVLQEKVPVFNNIRCLQVDFERKRTAELKAA
ncbi:MAG: hypothetical protein ABW118_08430 [Candidatus Thiodiazotropha sp.]